MTIIKTDCKDIYEYPCPHDPDEHKFYFFNYRPEEWSAEKVYVKNSAIVIPSIANGFMYTCVSGGKSSTDLPVFPTIENERVDDGTVTWKAIPYEALIAPDDVISLSTWEADDVATLIDSFTVLGGGTTGFRLYGVPVGATTVTVTNKVDITKPDATIWKLNRSILFNIKEL